MRILCIGDVCGTIGCEALRKVLPDFKRKNNIDVVIVNAENSADGNGLSVASAESIFASGASCLTGGNHTLRIKNAHEFIDKNEFVLRPANFLKCNIGKGISYIDLGRSIVAVINLIGTVYLQEALSPFLVADELIAEAKTKGANIIIVDFHAEATAEKKALGYYLDGRVSAIFGTHTHIKTADLQILPKGTGYITDLGMIGPFDSVLGVKPELSLARIKDGLPVKFQLAEGECIINGCIFNINDSNGLCESVETVDWRV